jgi:biopolymer transport protein ExbD
MAMNFDPAAGGDEPGLMVEMNTTPLIDVMLVLLVMLIITIPLQLHAVNLEMPVGVSPPQTVEPEIVKIDVNAASQVLWNGELVADRQALDTRLQAASTAAVQPEIHVRPDRAANYDVVASVLAASQRMGLVKIGIVGSEQFAR